MGIDTIFKVGGGGGLVITVREMHEFFTPGGEGAEAPPRPIYTFDQGGQTLHYNSLDCETKSLPELRCNEEIVNLPQFM